MRFSASWPVIVAMVGFTLMDASQAQSPAYTSPFAITLTLDQAGWDAELNTRSAAATAESSPSPADWYTTALNPDYPYGPLLPQLYSGNGTGADAAAIDKLRFDRGKAVFNSPLTNVPDGIDPLTWSQQRLLFLANSMIGTHYQHLHLPDFNPANADIAWKQVSTNPYLQTTQQLDGPSSNVPNPYQGEYGSAQQGIDCTDFSAYLYNIALGIQMHSGTTTQVEFATGTKPAVGVSPVATITDSNGAPITPIFLLGPNYGTTQINDGNDLEDATAMNDIMARLRPGDLLYMRSGDTISHVVVWLGAYGRNADGSPSDINLIISSHDNTPAIFDTNLTDPITGFPIGATTDEEIYSYLPPPGVQILPFTPDNWFYQNFSLAMQVLPIPEPGVLPMVGLGLLILVSFRRLV